MDWRAPPIPSARDRATGPPGLGGATSTGTSSHEQGGQVQQHEPPAPARQPTSQNPAGALPSDQGEVFRLRVLDPDQDPVFGTWGDRFMQGEIGFDYPDPQPLPAGERNRDRVPFQVQTPTIAQPIAMGSWIEPLTHDILVHVRNVAAPLEVGVSICDFCIWSPSPTEPFRNKIIYRMHSSPPTLGREQGHPEYARCLAIPGRQPLNQPHPWNHSGYIYNNPLWFTPAREVYFLQVIVNPVTFMVRRLCACVDDNFSGIQNQHDRQNMIQTYIGARSANSRPPRPPLPQRPALLPLCLGHARPAGALY